MTLTRKRKRELRKKLKAHWYEYLRNAEVSIGPFPEIGPLEWDFLRAEQIRMSEYFKSSGDND